MNYTDYIELFLNLLVTQLPVLVLSIFGLRATFSKLKSSPTAAKYSRWGFSLLILHSFMNAAIRVSIIYLTTTVIDSRNISHSMLWPNIVGLVAFPVYIAAMIFFYRAIFADRQIARYENAA